MVALTKATRLDCASYRGPNAHFLPSNLSLLAYLRYSAFIADDPLRPFNLQNLFVC